nr:putative reverse transcriptase, RNA-dependent DNA polymerase, Gag-polypeptide of LTR copia-type [Tanacetum cinerariifolium]
MFKTLPYVDRPGWEEFIVIINLKLGKHTSDPIPNWYGTLSPHSGSTYKPLNENEGGHSQSSNAAASKDERSSRPSVFPRHYNDFVVESKVKYCLEKYINYSNLSKENFCFASVLNKSIKPKSFLEASKHQPWVDAMSSAMDALYWNNTSELADLPKGRKAIGYNWGFKIKYKLDGEIKRYKTRLVAKHFNQREGIDFDETFSYVVKIVTVMCLINLVVQNGWTFYQMDVNNAFLYGDLNETMYISLPPSYSPLNETRVCKLNKLVYGLKHAPRQ